MSDYIPLEIQSEIIKWLPVKSLVQFRSVSKLWKSFIDNPEFIKKYHHINHTNPHQKHHLLVRYKSLDSVRTYTSIIDDNNNTFPKQKFPLTAPEPLSLLRRAQTLGSKMVCFDGWYNNIGLDSKMVVIWNPSIRKCVGIHIPNVLDLPRECTYIGFGVCPDTSDPKLVKINAVETPGLCSWDVQVFTLSSRVWKTVFTGAPLTSRPLTWNHVFIDGVIYWYSCDSFIVSFDLKTEKFGQVCIPKRLAGNPILRKVVKVNESLGLLEFYRRFGICDVWMKKDGVNQPFTRIYAVTVEGKMVFNTSVLGFRNNGDVVLETVGDDHKESTVEVYEPSSGRISGVGIKGEYGTFCTSSYMETLLLLNESNSVIH